MALNYSRVIGSVMLFQAISLAAIGFATFWWSNDWMLMLIHLVGEEYALGSNNVTVTDDGSKLLTNPGAMIQWTIPFWGAALVEFSASITLAVEGCRRVTKRST